MSDTDLETGRSLYEPRDYQACLDRIDRLTADSAPRWGSMNVAQMLSHCAEIQEVANGKELKGTPLIVRLFRGLIRRMVVSDKPYRRSTRTHPQYRQDGEKVFETEKRRLLAALEAFVKADGREASPHPLFGPMTREEKGWSSWKHLNHHLSQFDV